MRKKHSAEGIERIRAAILQNKPWLRSTGPRTEDGKRRASMNAFKHGVYSETLKLKAHKEVKPL